MKKTITHRELSTISMVGGNENKFEIVIHEGKLIQWVSIGWIELREARKKDYEKYPFVIN